MTGDRALSTETGVHRCRTLGGPVDAVVEVPGSKSIANRALVCAALADGESALHGLPDGDDTAAMIAGLGELERGASHIDARLAGTTSRFLTAVAALQRRPVTIDGAAPLRRRPMAPLHTALTDLGARLSYAGAVGHLPVTVDGTDIHGGTVEMAGDVSSQFISALMMVAPRLDGVTIALSTPLVSRPYLHITAAVMAAFGVTEVELGERLIRVGGGHYRDIEYTVEPDASSAGYPWAAAAITGGTVTVAGLTTAALQGDVRFVEVLHQMGCTVTGPTGSSLAPATTVSRPGALRGVDVEMGAMSDLVPTLAAIALFADSPTTIRGVGFIRAKESDRLGDLSIELRRLGADVQVTDDGLVIRPAALHGATLRTHHDHRLAMAFGLIGLAVPGVEISDPGVVAKSWPDYWNMLTRLERR